MEVNILADNSSPSKISEFLSNVADLSFVQIFILYVLVTFSMRSVRFSLLNQINDIYFQEKPLSPSSFYHSLQKLEKKGFVSFQGDEKSGKAKSVQATPLGKVVLQKISQLMIYSGLDMEKIINEFIPNIANKTKLPPVRSLLLIPFDELFHMELIDLHDKILIAEETNILTDDSSFERYLERGITNIHQTKFHQTSQMIREPDDIFDMAFLVRYRRTNKLFGISEKKLLQEVVRVVKPNGQLIIFTLDNISQTNHIILDSIGEMVKSSPFFFAISEEELLSDLKEVGIQDPTILNLNGVLIGRAIVP